MKRVLAAATMAAALMTGAGANMAQENADLLAYAGKYPWDEVNGVTFLDNPVVRSAVAAAVADPGIREAILTDTGSGNTVSVPMLEVEGRLYMQAFDPASGGDLNWGLLISADGTDAAVCFSTGVVPGELGADWYADGGRVTTRYTMCPSERAELEEAIEYWLTKAIATARGELQYQSCFGYFNTGSGMAGSFIQGDGACFIEADSEVGDMVSHTCGQGDICLVEAMVLVDPQDGRNLIQEVLSVNRVTDDPQAAGSYLSQAAGFVDGIYAHKEDGCDVPAVTSADRIAINLSRTQGPVIQMGQRYCAVVGVAGDAPNPEGFEVSLRLRCGAGPDEDGALRSEAEEADETIVLWASNGREIQLGGGTTLLRCPIRPAYTPEWWMNEPPSNALLLDY